MAPRRKLIAKKIDELLSGLTEHRRLSVELRPLISTPVRSLMPLLQGIATLTETEQDSY
jgi:hypothetical protein